MQQCLSKICVWTKSKIVNFLINVLIYLISENVDCERFLLILKIPFKMPPGRIVFCREFWIFIKELDENFKQNVP